KAHEFIKESFTILENINSGVNIKGDIKRRYLIKTLLLLILILPGFAWAEESFLNIFGGYGAHNQDSFEDSSTRPTGLAYGAGLGRRMDYYEFELNVSKGSYTADIEHDDVANKII